MPRIAIAHQLRARTSTMCLIIALAAAPANVPIAHWQFTYAYSGNLEDDRVYTQGADLYYARTAIDRQTGELTGITLRARMRIDNIRDVTIHRSTNEIHVQIWGILNTSVLVLHFTKAQEQLAQDVAREVERFEYSRPYLPMQNRAKMPVSSSSLAASPVS